MGAPRVVIAAGGTAGHVVPAIAVADALRAEGAEVSFVGGERAEAELVPAAGYALDPIRVEGISRSNPLKAARAVLKAGASLATARSILARRRADVVRGGGGYVAGPVGLAAITRRIPLVLTEADSHMGLTNRLLAGRARRVCLAFPLEGRDGDRYRVTGRPVPPRSATREEARAAFGLDGERCVLVFGGSLGARSINQAAVAAFADAPYRVLHIAGRRDHPDLTAPGPHYDLRDYVTPFGTALAAADLAVARSGGSIFELAQYGLPAVLIPYPSASGDHQTANARWMEEGGAATVLADAELTAPQLRTAVDAILLDPERLAAMAAAARALARPDAAADVAREVLGAARSSIRRG
jgi:UDP-N-acetylglucosamine--N-acetylmuramyl-(pentapeptide) pyrophosphoryl-undecaprenol N-acetylglucosamine transferase